MTDRPPCGLNAEAEWPAFAQTLVGQRDASEFFSINSSISRLGHALSILTQSSVITEREEDHKPRLASYLPWSASVNRVHPMKKRQSDPQEVEYRRAESRTFKRDEQWYFASREGETGPFESEAEAIADLEAYVMLIDLRPENEGPVTPD